MKYHWQVKILYGIPNRSIMFRSAIWLMTAIAVCMLSSIPAQAVSCLTPVNPHAEKILQHNLPDIRSKMKKKNLIPGSPIFIRIFKEPPELELWVKKERTYVLYKSFLVCDMSGDIGPKLKEGDRQAPEGFYRVGVEQMNPWSKHHLSFNLGFPNQFDRCHKRTGSALMVHGKCNSIGCFAMANYRMEEIYTLADAALAGCQGSFAVHIFPFRMTEKNMLLHKGKWDSFWRNLKEGYDIFEKTHIPPTVLVKNCRYVFGQ